MDARAWVELQLRTYCPPGTHDFRDLPGGHGRWCPRCFKEEPVPGGSCLVCSVATDDEVVLVTEDGQRLTGALCDVCREGLAAGSGGKLSWRATVGA